MMPAPCSYLFSWRQLRRRRIRGARRTPPPPCKAGRHCGEIELKQVDHLAVEGLRFLAPPPAPSVQIKKAVAGVSRLSRARSRESRVACTTALSGASLLCHKQGYERTLAPQRLKRNIVQCSNWDGPNPPRERERGDMRDAGRRRKTSAALIKAPHSPTDRIPLDCRARRPLPS